MIGAVLNLAGTVADKFIEDKDQKIQFQHELATQLAQNEHALITGQLEINKEEAKHESRFVAGWRPAVGWTCTFGLGYQIILRPIMQNIVNITDAFVSADLSAVEMVSLNLETLLTLLLGMLGIGGARTYEKMKGVNKRR